jgi:hypothetical protein
VCVCIQYPVPPTLYLVCSHFLFGGAVLLLALASSCFDDDFGIHYLPLIRYLPLGSSKLSFTTITIEPTYCATTHCILDSNYQHTLELISKICRSFKQFKVFGSRPLFIY